ncbi:unnamed protein product [Candidula unifasciata]|uniref:RanBP2-type domain-containing protein n=1 Tax=Candidula unifasciata TaxID=100452 RepID=A0A8S3ZJW8_9EUPU|nr:unnamed protein product [Candidula unifasciata]
MADAGLNFGLLSYLRAQYPLVSSATVVNVMNKYNNDQEKCKRALDFEARRGFGSSSMESLSGNNNNSSVDSSGEGKSITARIKELQVSCDSGSQLKHGNPERHISKLERSVGNLTRPTEQAKRPLVSQSVSFTVQTPGGLSSAETQTKTNWGSTNNLATPQTAPPDFSSFFSRSATDIPNINCRTHGASGFGSGSAPHGSKPKQIPVNSSSASSSPLEQRRPVKVINIPAGSSSGGTVSSSLAHSNQRHIHMNFGDSGGRCSIAKPPTLQRYGSTPNISQHYRSEIHTEAPTPQPVHSSNIVVNASNHTNSVTSGRKLSDASGNGRRTPNPPLSLNTSNNFSSILAPGGAYPSGKLSTPIQASSPGIAHSKPVFVDIKNDRMASAHMHDGYNSTHYPSVYYPGNSVRSMPLNSGLMPNQNMSFGSNISPLPNSHFSPDFSSAVDFPASHRQNEYLYSQNPQQRQPGFPSSSTNMGHPPNSGYSPSSYSQFHPPANVVGFTLLSGRFPGPAQGRLANYTHYGLSSGFPMDTHLSKSPSVTEHQLLSSRTNSQDSEHSIGVGGDYEAGYPLHRAVGSRVSSLSSLSSDSSGHVEGVTSGSRSRSGSLQDEVEYIQALLQHQKRQMQKLQEEISHHRVIVNKLHSEVSVMERSMIESHHVNRSLPSIEDISWLCEKNRQLQTDIQLYMNEVDVYRSGQTPLNSISPRDQQNFFENMPTGQQDPIYSLSPGRRLSPTGPPPPPRPPPPIPMRQRSNESGQAAGGAVSGVDIFRVPAAPSAQQLLTSGDPEEGELPWSCSACTFSNHPALRKCEMCEMPRVIPPHATLSLGPRSLNPQQSMSPRLPPGSSLLSNMHPRSDSPHSVLGHHYHRAGT